MRRLLMTLVAVVLLSASAVAQTKVASIGKFVPGMSLSSFDKIVHCGPITILKNGSEQCAGENAITIFNVPFTAYGTFVKKSLQKVVLIAKGSTIDIGSGNISIDSPVTVFFELNHVVSDKFPELAPKQQFLNIQNPQGFIANQVRWTCPEGSVVTVTGMWKLLGPPFYYLSFMIEGTKATGS